MSWAEFAHTTVFILAWSALCRGSAWAEGSPVLQASHRQVALRMLEARHMAKGARIPCLRVKMACDVTFLVGY